MEKGPEPLGEILSRLFTARGWGRRQERLRLEQAWVQAIGESGAGQTQVGGLRRGVLEVVVGNAVLMQEHRIADDYLQHSAAMRCSCRSWLIFANGSCSKSFAVDCRDYRSRTSGSVPELSRNRKALRPGRPQMQIGPTIYE